MDIVVDVHIEDGSIVVVVVEAEKGVLEYDSTAVAVDDAAQKGNSQHCLLGHLHSDY